MNRVKPEPVPKRSGRGTKAQVAENRDRIIAAAARAFRERGFEGIGVAELMRSVGLTHGGFYGHFASKEELMALACRRAVEDMLADWRAAHRRRPRRPGRLDRRALPVARPPRRARPRLPDGRARPELGARRAAGPRRGHRVRSKRCSTPSPARCRTPTPPTADAARSASSPRSSAPWWWRGRSTIGTCPTTFSTPCAHRPTPRCVNLRPNAPIHVHGMCVRSTCDAAALISDNKPKKALAPKGVKPALTRR